ncbi:MAG: response regulator [Alphaproteobacteria bacterium]|nr:response regulator [Alphaproteobacteria bacterium]
MGSEQRQSPPAGAERAGDRENHILVVDDDRRLRALLSRYLTENGFRVSVAADASEARQMMGAFDFDLAVVDVMMPGENGIDLTRDLRSKGALPILLLTAMDEPADRIRGLEGGADDYLTKPFEPRELVLRISSILRRARSTPARPAAETLGLGGIVVNLSTGILHRAEDGEEFGRLTTAELAMLSALAAKMGEPVSRDDLAAATGADGGERALDVQVTRLRRKIEADPKFPRFLVTVRGKGYMLQAG